MWVSTMKKYSFTRRFISLILNEICVKLCFRIVTSVSSPIIGYFIFCNNGVISCDGRRTYLPRPSHDTNSGSSGGEISGVDDGAA